MPVHLEQVNLHDVSDDKVVAVDDSYFHRISISSPDLTHLVHDAANATAAEHKMSLLEGLKTYPHAVGWSVLFSTAIIMEGFDTILMSNLFAYGPFQKAFGVQQADGTYQLTAAWQSGLSNAPLVGEILGLIINGIIAERFGYRKTIIGALSLVIAFIFIVFFAESLITLLIGEILLGVPWVSSKPSRPHMQPRCALSLSEPILQHTSTCVGLSASSSPLEF